MTQVSLVGNITNLDEIAAVRDMKDNSNSCDVNGISLNRPPAAPSVFLPNELVAEDALLEAYRSASEAERRNLPEFQLDKVTGHIVAFSSDCEGSRHIQYLVDAIIGLPSVPKQREKRNVMRPLSYNVTPAQELLLQPIVDEIRPHFRKVMCNAYGNYVILKLLELRSLALFNLVIDHCTGYFYETTMDGFGCRIMQNLLEVCAQECRSQNDAGVISAIAKRVGSLIHEVKEVDQVYNLIMDQNGNHVLQKCLMFFPQECAFVAHAMGCRFMEVANHVYGSRVIQCIFEQLKGSIAGPEAEQASLKLMMLAHDHSHALANTQYGNFVITHALVNSPDPNAYAPSTAPHDAATVIPSTVRPRLIQTLLPLVLEMSCSKFASNVAQRVFQYADAGAREAIVRQFVQPYSRGGVPNAVTMMTDQYANYVMQTVFDYATEMQKTDILKAIRPHIPQILKSHAGRHIIGRIAPEMLPAAPSHEQIRRHIASTHGPRAPPTPSVGSQRSSENATGDSSPCSMLQYNGPQAPPYPGPHAPGHWQPAPVRGAPHQPPPFPFNGGPPRFAPGGFHQQPPYSQQVPPRQPAMQHTALPPPMPLPMDFAPLPYSNTSFQSLQQPQMLFNIHQNQPPNGQMMYNFPVPHAQPAPSPPSSWGMGFQ